MKNKWLWSSVTLILISLIGFGVVQSQTTTDSIGATTPPTAATNSKPLPVVSVEPVVVKPLVKTINLTGAVIPTRLARLAAPVEGPVAACATMTCMPREGERVEKGQPLLEISRNQAAQAQLEAAQQTLREYQIELQRVTKLVEAGAVPGAQLDSAQSKYENARAQLAKAEEIARDYQIVAPWSGIISKVYVAEGDYIAPRTPLVEIFDPNSLVVEFAVPESQSTKIEEQMAVQIHLDAYPGQVFPGKVSRVYPGLNEKTRTRTVEATLSDPVGLLPGMFARIEVALERIPEAITVPANSLMNGSNGDFSVFVVENGKAFRRKVEIGMEINGRIQILSGLRAGDFVVVAGQEKLKDKAEVKMLKPSESTTPGNDKEGDRS